VRSLVSSARVSGHIGDARVWPLTVDTAVLPSQSIYLSARANGRCGRLRVPVSRPSSCRPDDRSRRTSGCGPAPARRPRRCTSR
jgi:hypothetical protein